MISSWRVSPLYIASFWPSLTVFIEVLLVLLHPNSLCPGHRHCVMRCDDEFGHSCPLSPGSVSHRKAVKPLLKRNLTLAWGCWSSLWPRCRGGSCWLSYFIFVVSWEKNLLRFVLQVTRYTSFTGVVQAKMCDCSFTCFNWLIIITMTTDTQLLLIEWLLGARPGLDAPYTLSFILITLLSRHYFPHLADE